MLVLRKNKKRDPDVKFAENQAKFAQLNKVFHGFSCHLRPFHFKRQFLAQILEAAENAAHRRDGVRIFTFSREMLETFNPITVWASHKSMKKIYSSYPQVANYFLSGELIRRKFALLASIRGELDESWAKHSSKCLL